VHTLLEGRPGKSTEKDQIRRVRTRETPNMIDMKFDISNQVGNITLRAKIQSNRFPVNR